MRKKSILRVLLLAALALPATLAGCGGTTSGGTQTSTPTAAGPSGGAGTTPTTVAVPPVPTVEPTIAVETPVEGEMGSPTAGAEATPGQWPAGSPEAAAYDLYNWYTHLQGNPLTTGAYKNSQYLTQAFIQRIDAMMMSARPGASADPILCAQNPPASFSVGRATTTDSHAIVPVTTQYASGTSPEKLQVVMVQESGRWKADSVTCPAP